MISAVAVRRCRPRLAPVFYLMALIISASILFMKQHYVLDLVGGLALSWLMSAVFLLKSSEAETEVLEPAAPA